MLEDAELLRRYVCDHSEAAFAALVARHVDLVYSAALRQVGGDAHRAHDVSQIVFTTLARKAAHLTEHPALVGWLYTATQHAAAKARRTETRRRAREHEAHLMLDHHASPDTEADWSRVRPVLDEAISELNERDRRAVLLRFFSQKPFGEIARQCALTEDAARMRVERALGKLQALLARRGITSTSAALGLILTDHAVAAAPASVATKFATTALSASGVASSALTGGALAQFMSTTKLNLSLFGGLALLATLGVSTYTWRARLVAEEELSGALQEKARHIARLQETERSAITAEQALVGFQKDLAEARARAADADAARVKAEADAAWNPNQEGAAFVDRHPEVKQTLYDYGVASQRFKYAEMFRALNLSPDQIQRWESLHVAGTMGNVLPDGRSISMPIGEPMEKRDTSQYGRQMTEILGQQGLRELGKFNAIASARTMASDVASSLYFTDDPLSGKQADHLVELLVASRNVGAAAKESAFIWTTLIAKAADVMTPTQLAVLEGKRASDLFHEALNRPRSSSATSANTGGASGK